MWREPLAGDMTTLHCAHSCSTLRLSALKKKIIPRSLIQKKKKTATSALYRKVSESAKCSRLFFRFFTLILLISLVICMYVKVAPSLLSPSSPPPLLRSSVTVISFSLFFSLFLFFLSPCFLLFRSPRPREMHKGPAASTHRKSQSSPAEVSFVLGALKVAVDWSRGVQRAAAMTRKAAGFCL